MEEIKQQKKYNEIKLRFSHLFLYRCIMTFAATSIGLGLNFLFTNPTFNPYNIPKELVGIVFLVLGVSKVVFLNFIYSLRIVRFTMAAEVGFIVFWGIGTSITYFQGKTSLQLFVLYVILFALLEIWAMMEPVINPVTERIEV